MRTYSSSEEGEAEEMSRDEVITLGEWEAIGPFTCGMREHPIYGTPLHAFPPKDPKLDHDVDFAYRPYDSTETWPCEIGVNGRIGWRNFGKCDPIKVSYPEIDWQQLRNDHGWAALQYQTLLRSEIDIPPAPSKSAFTSLLMDVIQGVEYAFVPLDEAQEGPVHWYNGDIYAYADTPAGQSSNNERLTTAQASSSYARSIALKPGRYRMLLRAMYEIRMFGDPGPSTPPTIEITIDIRVSQSSPRILSSLDTVPDVVDGMLMGSWCAVGIRNPATSEDLEVEALCNTEEVQLSTVQATRIAAGQTRMVAFKINQSRKMQETEDLSVEIAIKYKSSGRRKTIQWGPKLRHRKVGSSFIITFPSPSLPSHGPPALVSYAVIVPPKLKNGSPMVQDADRVPIMLCLHGAGVTPTSQFLTDAIPAFGGWAVLPTGRSEWGEDWRGGSMADAWAARESFGAVMKDKLGRVVSEKTMLVGHSNGGQGAWHLAGRYSDRIIGMLAAAGYTKIQDYVPYTEMFSNHYADPSLMGILLSSLTPYNNDLHLSNLTGIPVMAINGSKDGNVPPRHSRLQTSLVAAWGGRINKAKYLEVEGKDHWWDEVFKEPEVEEYINDLIQDSSGSWEEDRKQGFTLTCGNPDECGSRAGIKILELQVPGRLGRLDVNARQWRGEDPASPLDLRSTNVKRISIMPPKRSSMTKINLDGQVLAIPLGNTPTGDEFVYNRTLAGWELQPIPDLSRAYGPIIRILATFEPITIVTGTLATHISIAKRAAHDLFLNHRIDIEIVSDEAAIKRAEDGTLDSGNIIAIGTPETNAFTERLLQSSHGSDSLSFPAVDTVQIGGRTIKDRGTGLVALRPHPSNPKGLSLIVAGTDESGLEAAARLIPVRTGVPIPDWAIVSPRMNWQGAGGFIGAGFWGADWEWNESTSWIDRAKSPI